MADPSKPTTPFSFSQATRSDGGGGLFGQSTSNSSVFGTSSEVSKNSAVTTGGGLFGSTPAPTAPSGSLFGAAASGPAASSPFGGASGGANLFGGANRPATTSGFNFGPSTITPATSGGLFGSSQPSLQTGAPATTKASDSIFSTPSRPTGTPAASQPASNPFGGAPSGGNLFGSKADSRDVNTTPTTKQTTSLFGNSTTPAGPPPAASMGTGSGSVFSLNKPESQSSAPASNIFGGAGKPTGAPSSNMPPTASLFAPSSGPAADVNKSQGSQAPSQSSNVFGAPATGGTGLFGKMSQASQPESSSKIFDRTGQAPDAPAAKPAETKPTPSLFSNTGSTSTSNSQPTGSSSAPSLFANTAKQPSTPSFSFAKSSEPTAASSNTVKSPIAAQSSNLFGTLGASNAASNSDASATSKAGPKTSFFPSLDPPQSKPSDTTSASVPSSSAPSSAAPNPIGNTGKVASPSTIAKPQGSTTAAPAGANNANNPSMSASTAGPAPPARSRLKDKTMDDIITRWASDLSKYQKDFQAQAEKVASWDRMLVENSEKIQRLYGSTLEAERATSEVERQLTSVESDQAELESWLSHYEKEVDNMIQNQVGQNEGLSGPDQERERTYQLATKLTDRLDEMGKDLGSMIEEINDASSNLSKHTKSDDPLTQVVRVLNSHLTQLQQIDQGAAGLQLKVKEAQRVGQGMGISNGLNGPSSDAAEGFYRSYMGRG